MKIYTATPKQGEIFTTDVNIRMTNEQSEELRASLANLMISQGEGPTHRDLLEELMFVLSSRIDNDDCVECGDDYNAHRNASTRANCSECGCQEYEYPSAAPQTPKEAAPELEVRWT